MFKIKKIMLTDCVTDWHLIILFYHGSANKQVIAPLAKERKWVMNHYYLEERVKGKTFITIMKQTAIVKKSRENCRDCNSSIHFLANVFLYSSGLCFVINLK